MKVKLRKKYKDPDGRIYDLSFDKEYRVIGIEADDYRLIGEDGKPVLFSHKCFDITDNTEPKDWLTEYGEDGERYSYPPVLNKVGFFEDYFNGDENVVNAFVEYLQKNMQ